MRHTIATLLLATGVHPKVVQERLGHSSIQMTLDRYSHVPITMQQDAAAVLDRLIGEAARPKRGQDARRHWKRTDSCGKFSIHAVDRIVDRNGPVVTAAIQQGNSRNSTMK